MFGLALWYHDPILLEVWSKERPHPLQDQEPLGDRKYIKNFEFLQKLTKFEDSIGKFTLTNYYNYYVFSDPIYFQTTCKLHVFILTLT